MAITASQVKELREKTGAGMMDCKKALTECDGDMAKAVDWLREKGMSKAEKKAGRIAAEGLTRVAAQGNHAVIFEVNSETDFVAKNEQFLHVLDVLQASLLESKPASLEEALKVSTPEGTVEEVITNATATIGEKISFRRIDVVEKKDDEIFGTYMHMGGKISAVVVLFLAYTSRLPKAFSPTDLMLLGRVTVLIASTSTKALSAIAVTGNPSISEGISGLCLYPPSYPSITTSLSSLMLYVKFFSIPSTFTVQLALA